MITRHNRMVCNRALSTNDRSRGELASFAIKRSNIDSNISGRILVEIPLKNLLVRMHFECHQPIINLSSHWTHSCFWPNSLGRIVRGMPGIAMIHRLDVVAEVPYKRVHRHLPLWKCVLRTIKSHIKSRNSKNASTHEGHLTMICVTQDDKI